MTNQITPFEYVSILISLILGLGITQLISSSTDLLYHIKKVKFYWPHSLFILFILFLHIQDWFVTYQLRNKSEWYLTELGFVLLYPISLCAIAKMILPTNEYEEQNDMKSFYFSQYEVIFKILSFSIFISILFNIFLLKTSVTEQIPFIIFFIVTALIAFRRIKNEFVHKALSLIVIIISIASLFIAKEVWVIK